MSKNTVRGYAALTSALLIFALMATARAQSVAATSEPSVALRPALARARSEKIAGGVITALGLGFAALGGGIAGTTGSNRAWVAGFSMGVLGGALVFPGIGVAVYGAGRDAGLRILTDHAAEEAGARRIEIGGAVMVLGGLLLSASGCAMAIKALDGLSFGYRADQKPFNKAMFEGGIAISIIGDLLWLSGFPVWTYGSGLKQGVRESRRVISLGPTGVAGTF